MVTALLLDVDDTLTTTREAMAYALTHAVKAAVPSLTRQDAWQAASIYYLDPERAFRAYTRGELAFPAMRERRLRRAFADVGAPFDPASIPAFEEAYDQRFLGRLRLHADAERLLARLASHGVPWGLLTNANHALTRRKLATVGIAEPEVLVAADTLGVGKPAPRIFHHACKLLGAAPADTTYVGDEFDVDAQGAAAAGMPVVWLKRHRRAGHGPTLTVGEARRLGIPAITSLDRLDVDGRVGVGGGKVGVQRA